MDSDQSYSNGSAATRLLLDQSGLDANLATFCHRFNEICEQCQPYHLAEALEPALKGDNCLANLIMCIGELMTQVGINGILNKKKQMIIEFLCNFLTVNANSVAKRDQPRLLRAVSRVLLVFSSHHKLLKGNGLLREMKVRVLECGYKFQDNQSKTLLRRAGKNLLRIQ